jgi:hypothetical protein
MSNLDEPKSSDNPSERSQGSLSKLIARSLRAIAQSRARIARSRALSRSEANLARAIDQIGKEEASPMRNERHRTADDVLC